MKSAINAMTPKSIQTRARPDTTQYQVGGFLAGDCTCVSFHRFVVCASTSILGPLARTAQRDLPKTHALNTPRARAVRMRNGTLFGLQIMTSHVRLLNLLVCCCLLLPVHVAVARDALINVATYNIRYNNPQDGINAWPHRLIRR